ncbi:MAG: hypothetical protein WD534_00080 [Phycisphaeraceae bacterium]
MIHFSNLCPDFKHRWLNRSWLVVISLALPCLLAGCASFGKNCSVPDNLAGIVYAPVEPMYAIGNPSRIFYLRPRSQLLDRAVVQFYEERGTDQRGPDKIHGVLTPEDRLIVTQVCRETNSAYDGLVAYGEILSGPLRGKRVRLYGVVTVGNTGVEVMDFSTRMRELQERRDAGEPLDFSYYQVDDRYLVPTTDHIN